jgi:hypothetical protein
MTARLACLSILLFAAVLPGCLPEARIAWSPDGRYALVRGGDGLYLCDGEGKLSARIAPDVSATAWMPDSRQFIAVTGKTVATWTELAPHLLEPVAGGAVSAQAEDFRRQVLAYKGDWDKFAFSAKPSDIVAALMCLRDEHGKELAPVVGDKWGALKNLQHTVYTVRLFGVSDGQAKPGEVLFETPGPVAEIRVAPGGKAFAYAAPPYPPENAEPTQSLFVVALAAPDKARRVDNRVSIFFDWTPDGRALVYACTALPDSRGQMPRISFGTSEPPLTYRRSHFRDPEQQPPLRGGQVVRRQVLDEQGALAEPEKTGLADVLFFDSLPVRCPPDGSVLFAAREVRLPAPAGESPEGFGLFSLSAAAPKALRQVLKPDALKEAGAALHLLQLSPDGTRICVPGEEGRIFIVDLATGQVTKVDVAGVQGRLPTIPVWRSKDELCFVVPKGSPAGSANRNELVLWSSAGSRCLSKNWPEAAAKGLLEP